MDPPKDQFADPPTGSSPLEQPSLFPGYSASPGSTSPPHATSEYTATLHRLYGSLSQLAASSSRSSLPGILEEGGTGERAPEFLSADLDSSPWHMQPARGPAPCALGLPFPAANAPGGQTAGAPPQREPARSLRLTCSSGSPVPEETIYMMAEAYGEVAGVSRAADGSALLSFHDSRAAVLAEHMMDGVEVGPGRSLRVSAAPRGEGPALGALLAAATHGPLDGAELARLLARYGDVAGVRHDPVHPARARVDFYDARAAAAALQGLAAGDDAALRSGARLVLTQASGSPPAAAPGAPAAAPPAAGGHLGRPPVAPSSAQHQYPAIEEQLAAAGLAGRGSPPGMPRSALGSSAALLAGAGLDDGGRAPALGHLPFSASAPVLDALLLGGAPGATLAAAQQQAAEAAQAARRHASMLRSLSEMSLEGLGGYGAGGGAGGGSGPAPLGLVGPSLSAGDLFGLGNAAAIQALYGVQDGAHGGGGGSLWPPASAPGAGAGPANWSDALLGGAGTGGVADISAAIAAQQQQQALLTQQLLQQQQATLAQGAAVQAALQQALLTQQLLGGGGAGVGLQPGAQYGDAAGGGGWGAPGHAHGGLHHQAGAGQAPHHAPHQHQQHHHGQQHHHHVPRSRSEAALGGRLARRPLDAGAEAERRAQQERLYALDVARIAAGEDRRTTLMIRNIPNKYTQKMLLALIEEQFRGAFDFFYLPIDFKNKCNVGYAFINMVRPSSIPGLVAELHGKRWPKFNSEKVCCITYGRIQGKAALVQHFQNSSLLHEDKRCRPILFHTEGELAGEPETFPPEP
ncbi:MEI2 [Auxenochlorella protothecoides x Auxenochlorella symbiontica]